MPTPPLIALAIALVAGVALATQAPLNAGLARTIGGGLAAATISFGVGFAVLLVLSLVLGEGPALARAGAAPAWMLAGGTLGAFYVWAAIWGVPRLGVLTLTGLVILGQMSAALMLDRIGAFGLPVQQISATRLAAAGLVAAGVVLSRL